jgi:hypothetical protein
MAETYLDRLKKDLVGYFKLPAGSVVTDIYEDCVYREGCPTCGGDYEFSVRVYYKDDTGSSKSTVFNSSMADFLSYVIIKS